MSAHVLLNLLNELRKRYKMQSFKKIIIASLCMQRCYGRHYASRKSVNH